MDSIHSLFRYLLSGYIFLLTLGISIFLICPSEATQLICPSEVAQITQLCGDSKILVAIITLFAGFPLGFVFYKIQYWIYKKRLSGKYKDNIYEFFKGHYLKEFDEIRADNEGGEEQAWAFVAAKHDFALFQEEYDRIRKDRILFTASKIYGNISVIVAIVSAHVISLMYLCSSQCDKIVYALYCLYHPLPYGVFFRLSWEVPIYWIFLLLSAIFVYVLIIETNHEHSIHLALEREFAQRFREDEEA